MACLSAEQIDLKAQYALLPKPRIPVSPVLSSHALGIAKTSAPGLLNLTNIRYVTSGRSAIALALKELNICPGDKILMPAYHCTSMIDPVIWLKAIPSFYQITEAVEVDLSNLRQMIDEKTKALLVTHYFGFHQPIARLRAFCDENHIALIEDCAHALFGTNDGLPIGGYGDYSVASSMKFLPVYDGGILASSNNEISGIKTISAGPLFEIKAALNMVEKAIEYGRLSLLKPFIKWPLALKDMLWKFAKSDEQNKSNLGPASSDGGYGFDPAWVSKKMSLASKYVLKHANQERLVEKRRKNYALLEKAFSNVDGVTSLYSKLPDNVVPYVFPLLVHEPEAIFIELKQLGVPILRFGEFLWDGVDESVCPVSVNLSRRVFQLPCHQELKLKELEWMVEMIKNVLQQKHH